MVRWFGAGKVRDSSIRSFVEIRLPAEWVSLVSQPLLPRLIAWRAHRPSLLPVLSAKKILNVVLVKDVLALVAKVRRNRAI